MSGRTIDREFRKWAAGLAGALLWLAAAPAQGAVSTLELIDSPVTEGAAIRLKELVRNPSSLPLDWAERAVLDSPAPGKSLDVPLTHLARALQVYPDMQEVVLRGQRQVTVKRGGVAIPQDKIVERVRAYVSSHARWQPDGAQVACDAVPASGTPPDSFDNLAVISFAPDAQPHRYTFTLAPASGDQTNRTLTVRATVLPLQRVWVARTLLPRGHTIRAADLETQVVAPSPTSEYVPADEDIEGLELDRAARMNEPLTRAAVLQPVCVERGDPVNVSISRGTLQVMLKARALATGRRGDRILCLNENSKRRLSVKMTGAREATMDI